MNESTFSDNADVVPWPTDDLRMRLPESTVSSDSDKGGPQAVGMMKQAVEGAHATLDRLADSATPAVQQLGERVSAVEDALRAKAAQLRVTGDEWAESARTTVRAKPLWALAVAVTFGAVLASFTRRPSRKHIDR